MSKAYYKHELDIQDYLNASSRTLFMKKGQGSTYLSRKYKLKV